MKDLEFTACATAGEDCPTHKGLCADPDARFVADHEWVFPWEMVLADGSLPILMLSKTDLGTPALKVQLWDAGRFVRAPSSTSAVDAEMDLWVRMHRHWFAENAPSLSGWVPTDGWSCCDDGRPLRFGRESNLLGFYYCPGCMWSEKGPVAPGSEYACQKTWPADVLVSVGSMPFAPPTFFAYFAGVQIVAEGQTMEEAEQTAFDMYLEQVTE